MAVFEKRLILVFSVLLLGCQSKIKMKELAKEELEQVFLKEKNFILELSKEKCPYCIMINEKETAVNTYNHLPEYKYILPADSTEADVSELAVFLDPLKYVPCFTILKMAKWSVIWKLQTGKILKMNWKCG